MSALELKAPLTVTPSVTLQESLDLLNREGFDQVPVVGESGYVYSLSFVVNGISLYHVLLLICGVKFYICGHFSTLIQGLTSISEGTGLQPIQGVRYRLFGLF